MKKKFCLMAAALILLGIIITADAAAEEAKKVIIVNINVPLGVAPQFALVKDGSFPGKPADPPGGGAHLTGPPATKAAFYIWNEKGETWGGKGGNYYIWIYTKLNIVSEHPDPATMKPDYISRKAYDFSQDVLRIDFQSPVEGFKKVQ